MSRSVGSEPLVVGWKEYVDLPDLGVMRLKAKMDTGARTSALHVASYRVDDGRVHMTLLRHRSATEVEAEAPLRGWLEVRSSSGEQASRPVIRTTLCVGDRKAAITLTLADRTDMLFRILIGRKALERLGTLVDASSRYLLGRRVKR